MTADISKAMVLLAQVVEEELADLTTEAFGQGYDDQVIRDTEDTDDG